VVEFGGDHIWEATTTVYITSDRDPWSNIFLYNKKGEPPNKITSYNMYEGIELIL